MVQSSFFNLSPNKHVDREMFISALTYLRKYFEIDSYAYTGFGSFCFDDFRLIHEKLGIKKMTSLESDSKTFDRACFNRPYRCINIVNESFGNYLAELTSIEEEKGQIFWLDYMSPQDIGTQIKEYHDLLSKLSLGDIVKITLNAQPFKSSRSSDEDLEEERKKAFKERQNLIPDAYFPVNYDYDCMTLKRYPLFLFDVLKQAFSSAFSGMPLYFNELYSTVYKDSTQMLTAAGIVLERSSSSLNEIRDGLSGSADQLKFINFDWGKINYIDIPDLSTKEYIKLLSLLPCEDDGKEIEKELSFVLDSQNGSRQIQSLVANYATYPNFHVVRF